MRSWKLLYQIPVDLKIMFMKGYSTLSNEIGPERQIIPLFTSFPLSPILPLHRIHLSRSYIFLTHYSIFRVQPPPSLSHSIFFLIFCSHPSGLLLFSHFFILILFPTHFSFHFLASTSLYLPRLLLSLFVVISLSTGLFQNSFLFPFSRLLPSSFPLSRLSLSSFSPLPFLFLASSFPLSHFSLFLAPSFSFLLSSLLPLFQSF